MWPLAICGTRTFHRAKVRELIVKSWGLVTYTFPEVSLIVSGGGGGVDDAAEDVARKLTGQAAMIYKADWDKHGKAAGPLRNTIISQKAKALLLIWDEKSPGSADVFAKFNALKKPVLQIIADSMAL